MKKLKLSKTDVKIAGVCGGIAEYLEIDSTVIRLLFIISIFMGGAGIPAYLICWVIMPRE